MKEVRIIFLPPFPSLPVARRGRYHDSRPPLRMPMHTCTNKQEGKSELIWLFKKRDYPKSNVITLGNRKRKEEKVAKLVSAVILRCFADETANSMGNKK